MRLTTFCCAQLNQFRVCKLKQRILCLFSPKITRRKPLRRGWYALFASKQTSLNPPDHYKGKRARLHSLRQNWHEQFPTMQMTELKGVEPSRPRFCAPSPTSDSSHLAHHDATAAEPSFDAPVLPESRPIDSSLRTGPRLPEFSHLERLLSISLHNHRHEG